MAEVFKSDRRAQEFRRLHAKWMERLDLGEWEVKYETMVEVEGARTMIDKLARRAVVVLGRFGPLTPRAEALAMREALRIALVEDTGSSTALTRDTLIDRLVNAMMQKVDAT